MTWATRQPEERQAAALAVIAARDEAGLWGLVEAYVTTWGRAGAKVSPHTLRAYRSGVRAFLKHAGWAALAEPHPDAAALYLRALEGRGLAPASVNSRRAAAGALFRALRWAQVTSADPFRDVPPVRDPTARHDKRRPYPAGDVARLLALAEGADARLVALGAKGGLRVSEMTRLEWAHVDLAARRLVVVGGKGGKTSSVAVYQGLLAVLARVPAGERQGFVLPWRTSESVRARLKALCARAGVAYLGVHALRHSCGTDLYRVTGRLDIVQQQLRHSNVATTQIYAKWADEAAAPFLDQF